MAANAEYNNLPDIILPVVGLANTGAVVDHQTMQFLSVHRLKSTNNFGHLEPHKAKDLVKSINLRHPDSSLGILVQNYLTGLIWYVKDQHCWGLAVDLNDINKDVLLNGI